MSARVRWEYARVVVSGMDQPIAANFSHSPEDDREYGSNDLAEALRDLGDAGWEMVSDARIENWIETQLIFREMLYFKRPQLDEGEDS